MDLVNHLEGRLLFAIPKKGRLNQACIDLLHGSDIQFRRNDRLDIALVKNLPLALIFLPAADIPTFVGEGRVDLGITGRDQVAEHEVLSPPTHGSGVDEVMDLGFGKCSLCVQVPEHGQLQTPQDLVGRNISTSFTHLAGAYFRDLESGLSKSQSDGQLLSNGVNGTTSTSSEIRTKIMYVGGSVEASCALGVADGIVDLVESGETMRAAGLKSIATVLESTAILIKSKHPSNESLVRLITARLRGVITAQRYVLCTYNVPQDKLSKASQVAPGKRAPTVNKLEEPGWVAVSVMVRREAIAGVMDQLSEEDIGAEDILVTKIDNSRTS